MNELKIFQYKSNPVRVLQIGNETWFVAKDVCDVLEIRNHRDAIRALDDDEKITVGISDSSEILTFNSESINSASIRYTLNLISEPGLYALIFRSRKPEARLFSRWVRHDVLPEVRATGSYNSEGSNQLKIKAIQTMLEASYISDETKAILAYELTKLITGRDIPAMLPEVNEKWYSAADIGKAVGLTPAMVGRISNAHKLKENSDYGRWVMSKSKYSCKEVQTFVYNERGLAWFRDFS